MLQEKTNPLQKMQKTIETGEKRELEREDDAQMESTDKATEVELTLSFTFLILLFRKRVPEAKCFVARARDDGFAVGAHGEVQYSVGMTGQ